jgi:hypothetical protein
MSNIMLGALVESLFTSAPSKDRKKEARLRNAVGLVATLLAIFAYSFALGYLLNAPGLAPRFGLVALGVSLLPAAFFTLIVVPDLVGDWWFRRRKRAL